MHNLVGPSDPLTNLRPLKLKAVPGESQRETRLRELRLEAQEFNRAFWLKHNREFAEARGEYVRGVLADHYPEAASNKKTLSADEMSAFYKAFLDDKWKSHLAYNVEWQKRNFAIVALALRIKVEKIVRV